MSYGSAYRAAYDWALITQDQSWATTGALLYAGQRAEAEERKLGSAE